MKIQSSEIRVVFLYALFGSLWILLSDRLVAALVTDTGTLTTIQTYKGWAFVASSALLILVLLRRELGLRQTVEGNFSRSEERYSLLVEHSMDAILISAPDGSIHTANPAATRMFGWTETQIRQLGRKGIVDPTDPRLQAALEERIQTGSFHGELTLVRSDGTKFPGEVTTALFIDSAGNERTSMIIRDISERKQMEQILRRDEARFRSAFDNMLEGAQIIGHDWRYLYLNPAAEVHNRRPNQELLGQRYMDMWPGIEDTHVFSVIRRCLEEREASRLENRFVYPDGKVGWFDLGIQPVPEGILILSFDVTERVRAEKQAVQMKRLYATLSQVNQTIVRVKNQDDLYQSICDLAVKFGEFALVWVGLLDEDSGDIRPVTATGLDVNHWPFPIVNIKHGPYQNGVISEALRNSTVVTSEDIETDERTQSLHGIIKDFDFHSLAAVPFRLKGRTIGVLSLISRGSGFFKAEEERSLLDEMGLDISFALETMEAEKERKRVEEALRQSEQRFRALVEIGKDEIVVFDDRLKPIYMSPSVLREAEYSWEEMVDAAPFSSVYHEDRPVGEEIYEWLLQHPGEYKTYQLRLVRRDGSLRWTEGMAINLLDHPSVGGIVLNYRDITAGKQAAQALIEAKEKYLSIFVNAMEAITQTTPDGRYITANPAAARILGYQSPEELIHSVTEMDHQFYAKPGRRTEFKRLMEEHGSISGFESEVYRKDGSTIWISENSRAIRDERGTLRYYEGTAQDITERRKAEEALRASEENYRSLAENSESAIALLDRNGRILYANSWAIRTWNDPQIVGKTIFDIYPKEYADRYSAAIKQVIDTQTGLHDDVESLINGQMMWFRLSMSPLKNLDGTVDKLLLNAWDMTRHKQAEEAVLNSEKRFRALIENGLDQISLMNPQGELIWESPSAVRTLGYAENTFLQHDLFELMHPDDMEWTKAQWMQLLQEPGGRREAIFRLQHADGSWRWIEAIVTNMQNEPAVNALVVNYRDVSERKQAEQALLRSAANQMGLIESTDDQMWSVDAQYRLIVGNAEFHRYVQRALGRALAEGENILHETIPPELRDEWRGYFDRALGGERFMVETQTQLVQPPRYRELCFNPIHGAEGHTIGVAVSSRDITERKRAEEALRESERQMRALVTSLDDIVFEFDVHGKYLNIWAADESLLARPKTQLFGRTIVEVLGEENGRPFTDAVKRVLASGNPESIEYPLEIRGAPRWFLARVSPILTQDNARRTASMLVRDITERRLAEREIQFRNEDLLLINTLNNAVNRGEDIEGIVEAFSRETRDVFACQDAAIYLLSPDAKYIEMQGSTLPRKITDGIEKLIGHPIPRIRIPLRDGSYFKNIMDNEQGMITSDPKTIQQWIEEFTETTFLPAVFRSAVKKIVPQVYKTLDIGSTISIPLISSGRAIGILDMSSKGQFTEEDLRRIRNISYQITAILLRKQAEKQVQLQLRRMSAMSEIDRAISSSLDMRVSLEILISEVLTQLGVHAASVLLLNASSNHLEYVAGKGFRTLGIRQMQIRLGEGLAGRVGLERKVLHIPVLAEAGELFKRAELLRNEEFVEYVGVPLVAKGVLKGVLEIFHRTPLNPDAEWVNYLETLGQQAAIAIDNAQLFESTQRSNLELVTAYDSTIAGWSQAMDLRDRETEGHTQRVTELTLRLAQRMGFRDQELVHLRRGALLHDIGKLGVPDHILHKPGPLTEEEWIIMRRHPTHAFEMLMPINYLRPALDIPYCHHEKWDGSGYPRGLKGEQIPQAARLFAVVDVWDAVTGDRPYRPAWSRKKAMDYIKEQTGRHFDPQVVETFLGLMTNQ